MPQIPTLPPKWPRSGVTFHCTEWFNYIEKFRLDEKRSLQSTKKTAVVDVGGRRPLCTFLLLTSITVLFYWSTSTKKSAVVDIDSPFYDQM